MPLHNLLCPICTEIFHDAEDIYSTSCGHVFHQWCLREWQSRSTSCPQCHQHNPTTHKLCLSFDESYTTFTEIQNKLQASDHAVETLKIKLLERSIELVQCRVESEKDIADLKKLIANLKGRILRFEGSDLKQRQQIVKLTQEVSSHNVSSETTIAELKKENDILKKDLDNMAIEFAIEVSTKVPSPEDNTQKPSQQSELCPTTSKIAISKGSNEIMVVRSEGFDRETTKNTKLVKDKIEPENNIRCLQSKSPTNNCMNTSIKNQVSTLENYEKLPNSGDTQEQSSIRILTTGNVTKDVPGATRLFDIKTDFISVLQSDYLSLDLIDQYTDRSIVIQNYPLNMLHYPLEKTVLLLANNMDITLEIKDIDRVFIMGLNETIPIYIRFKTKNMKAKFLTQRKCLSTFHVGITVKGYVDEESIKVFLYARNKLLYKGFKDVYWTNNKILAKKDEPDYGTIRIYSCQHVEMILKNLKA